MLLAWQVVVASVEVLAQDLAKQPLLLRLDGAKRAKVLAALAGLVILGFLLVTLAWLGGRMTRRYMNAGVKLKPTAPPTDDEWTRPPPDSDVKAQRASTDP